MYIVSVDIDLVSDKFKAIIQSHYQFMSMYLTLFISDWIKNQKLNLGSFNRIIFEEGGASDDFLVVGDRAFIVCLPEDFEGVEKLTADKPVHEYFIKKYLEGFERLDKKFSLNLTDKLRLFLEQEFNEHLSYEKKIKSKKIGDSTILVFHKYKYDAYELIVRVLGKGKQVVKEEIIYTCDPDPFVVHFDINKIEINNNKITVINKVRDETLIYDCKVNT